MCQWLNFLCLSTNQPQGAVSQPTAFPNLHLWSGLEAEDGHAFWLTGPNKKWKAQLRTASKRLLVPLPTSLFNSVLTTYNQANKQKKGKLLLKTKNPHWKRKREVLFLFFVDTIKVWVNNAKVCYYWSFSPGPYSFYANVTLIVKIVQRYVQKHVIHTF